MPSSHMLSNAYTFYPVSRKVDRLERGMPISHVCYLRTSTISSSSSSPPLSQMRSSTARASLTHQLDNQWSSTNQSTKRARKTPGTNRYNTFIIYIPWWWQSARGWRRSQRTKSAHASHSPGPQDGPSRWSLGCQTPHIPKISIVQSRAIKKKIALRLEMSEWRSSSTH